MHVRKWKKTHYPYNPVKPKVIRFGPNQDAPHAQQKWVWLYNPEIKDLELKLVGCKCKACNAYYDLIKTLNPKRYNELFAEPDKKFFHPESLPEHVHRRRNLAKSIGSWRG